MSVLVLDLSEKGSLSVLLLSCWGGGDTQRNFLLKVHPCLFSQGQVLEVVLKVGLLLLLHLKAVKHKERVEKHIWYFVLNTSSGSCFVTHIGYFKFEQC